MVSDTADDIRFAPYLLGYLDLMGYKKKVAEASNDHEQAAMHIVALRQSLKDAEDFTRTLVDAMQSIENPQGIFHAEMHVLSDTILIAQPSSLSSPAGSAWTLAVLCAKLVNEMIALGYPVRGAMVRGKHYHEPPLLFSEAVVQAHEMENKMAVYPRVLLTPSLADEYFQVERAQLAETKGNYREFCCNLVWRDSDGWPMLNYLQQTFWSVADDKPADLQVLRNHKTLVEDGLSKFRDRQYEHMKYRWMASYHNLFCRFRLKESPQREMLLIPNSGKTQHYWPGALPQPHPEGEAPLTAK